MVNGIIRALRPVSRLLRDKFPRPPRAVRNGSSARPCSPELCRLIDMLGDSIQAAFFTSSTERNWSLHKALLRTRCTQLCFRPDEISAIGNFFLAVPEEPLETFKGPAAFVHQDLVVIDANDPGPLWPLLKA